MNTLTIVLIVIGLLIALALFGFWLFMFVHCVRTERLERNERWGWGLAILFGEFIGAGFYYFMRYRPIEAETRALSR